MKLLRAFIVFISLLFITSPSWAANDWSGESGAVWNFDNDATDSLGGNDLTEINTPAYDAGDKKQGTHSIDFDSVSAEYCLIADGDLDAGFPCKSGVAEQSFTLLGWVKFETLTDAALTKKWAAAGNRSFNTILISGELRFYISHDGTNSVHIDFGTSMTTGIWYHWACTYDAATNGMKIRIWDDNAGALLDVNETGTADGDCFSSDASLVIGNHTSAYQNGKSDEVVVLAGKALSDADIDKARAGTYGAVGGAVLTPFWFFQ